MRDQYQPRKPDDNNKQKRRQEAALKDVAKVSLFSIGIRAREVITHDIIFPDGMGRRQPGSP